jgi:hypothetical protein
MGNMVLPVKDRTVAVAVRSDGQIDWQFKLGQCVSHKDQSMPSLVLSRTKAGRLGEMYGVRSFATVDPNRDRIILGSSLVNVVPNSEPCRDCMLFLTGMCPGDKR